MPTSPLEPDNVSKPRKDQADLPSVFLSNARMVLDVQAIAPANS